MVSGFYRVVMQGFGLNYLYNKLVFLLFPNVIGENVEIIGKIQRIGRGKVTIGNNVLINSCRRANPIGGDDRTILFAKENAKIKIGNNVGISNSAIVAYERITIEDDVLIGGSCKIYDNDFHSLDFATRMAVGCVGVMSKPVVIKQGAFIGAHSIILKGVTVGQYSIIGAGSVVTKDVPDGEIWAGNPARFIRKIK